MENKNENVQKFLKYLSKPLTIEVIDGVHSHHNIIFERAELYCDFILTLNDLIITTYLGDILTNNREKINHFNWCWNKTCELLSQPKIHFGNNDGVYEYFMNFYFDTYYLIPNKEEEKEGIDKLGEVWEFIFDYNIEKSRSELDSFITVYKLFDKSYKK